MNRTKDMLIGLAFVLGVGGAALRSEFMLIIALLCVIGFAVMPLVQRFDENRAREQRKPEKYHFTS